MDHDTATKGLFAERFFLGELNDDEREAYEDHFFACQACAEEIRVLFQFIQRAKQVFALR
jgi:hypothetical protein